MSKIVLKVEKTDPKQIEKREDTEKKKKADKLFFRAWTVEGLELDEEPAEVEMKPILTAKANISVVVEPPSSDEVDSSEALTEPPPSPSPAAAGDSSLAGLAERFVEGAEEPHFQRSNSTSPRGTVPYAIFGTPSRRRFAQFFQIKFWNFSKACIK